MKRQIFWYLMLFFLGFIVIIASIYGTRMYDCSDYCCQRVPLSKSRWGGDVFGKPKASVESLTNFSRKSQKDSGSDETLAVLMPFFSTLRMLSIPHQPIYTVASYAATSKNNMFPYRNRFTLITVSGKTGRAFELFATIYLAQLLARPNGVVILSGVTPDSEAAMAWMQLIEAGILHWSKEDLYEHDDQIWVKGRFKQVESNMSKCVSEYLQEVLNRYLELDNNVTRTRYYFTSKEREDEIREVYQRDTSYLIRNVTGLYHGMILKVLFPSMKIVIGSFESSFDVMVSVDPAMLEEQQLFEKGSEFLRKYILVS